MLIIEVVRIKRNNLETHKTVDISPRSSPSTSTDSFVDINRVVQSDVQQASSEFTTSQEKG